MTRATVGGINSEDNLWYPLAVDSRGVAQIDTSVIPAPYVPESGTFTPLFTSTDGGLDFAIIEYNNGNYGKWIRIYDVVYFWFFINTRSCTITNPRGNLTLQLQIPYIYDQNYGLQTLNIGRAINFADSVPFNSICGIYVPEESDWRLQIQNDDNTYAQQPMLVTQLREAASSAGNNIVGSGMVLVGDSARSSLLLPDEIG